jgi:spore germination protein (amino acid permease)
MIKKPTINPVQLFFLLTGSALMFPYTILPVIRTPPANHDSWVVTIIMFFYLVILNLPLLFLANKFRGFNIIDTTEIILGKFFGKIVLFLFSLVTYFCYIACLLLALVFMNIFIFPDTPNYVLLLFTIVPIVYATFKDAGTIARLAIFIVPFIMFTIVFFFLLGYEKMDLIELRPFLTESSFIQLNVGAFINANRYTEILIFVIFSYFLKQNVKINKLYAVSLGMYGIAILLIVIPTITVLGNDYAQHCWNPYYIFTRQVEGYDFIQRVQSFNALAWFMGMLLKLSIYSFLTCYIFSGIVKAKSHKTFIIPFAIIAFFVCLLPFMERSTTIEKLRSDSIMPWIIFPITFIIPLLTVIVYFFRRKKIKYVLKRRQAALEQEEN